MTIDNYCDRDQQGNKFPVSQVEAHALIALEQSALCAARLAIARWINNSSGVMPIRDAAQAKVDWYAQSQHNFQEWLERGGFAQYDAACDEQFPAVGSGVSTTHSCIE